MRLAVSAALLAACTTSEPVAGFDAAPPEPDALSLGVEWPGECPDTDTTPGNGTYEASEVFRYEIGGEGTIAGPEEIFYEVAGSTMVVDRTEGGADRFEVAAEVVGGCHVSADWGTGSSGADGFRTWICETECGLMIGLLQEEQGQFLTADAVRER